MSSEAGWDMPVEDNSIAKPESTALSQERVQS